MVDEEAGVGVVPGMEVMKYVLACERCIVVFICQQHIMPDVCIRPSIGQDGERWDKMERARCCKMGPGGARWGEV